MRIRLEGAVSDLHAVDAKYHKKCYLDFVNVRNIKAVQNHFNLNNPDEEPFNYVLQSIRSESEKVWSSVELMDAYLIRGGTEKIVPDLSLELRITLRMKYIVSRPKALQLF